MKYRTRYCWWCCWIKSQMSSRLWIFLIILFGLFNFVWSTPATVVPDENGPLSEIQTAVDLEVSLPCDLLPSSNSLFSDKVTLVIWYKEGHDKPIYTFDARGKDLHDATHWADLDVLKTKAKFYYDQNPPALRIRDVMRDDAGLYRCRVDFQKSPTRNSRINLTVLVPPTKLTILDNQGAEIVDNILGPYNEGATINVTCLSSGGSPPPRVSWWREHALLDDSFQVLPDGSVKNILHLSKISRRDLHSIYTCQASNGHVVPPLSSTVKLEMRLPPMYVRLQGLNHPFVAGLRIQFSCSTAGARPPPQIVWNKSGFAMRGASQTTTLDGNVTVSELTFLPAPEDNGKSVTCSVATETASGGVGLYLKDSKILDIKHAPIVSLSLGAPLNPHNLMKGTDVYLECDIKANPPIKRVEWFHNEKQLHSTRGVIISNQTLVLQGITKATHGQYMCRATNAQGTVNSNEIYLDVKYPPVCKSESQIIRAAVKQTINITCEVDANPLTNIVYKWSFNNTVENVSELPVYSSIIDNDASMAMVLRQTNDISYGPSIDKTITNSVAYQNQKSLLNKSVGVKSGFGSGGGGPGGKGAAKIDLNSIYAYKVETFVNFGTVMCTAENDIGLSAPCMYHVIAADLPEPVKNCTAFNETSSTVHVACIPGKDGGIQQHFHVEVADLSNRAILYNVSFKNSHFILKRLPSDTDFIVKVTSYNLQGSSGSNFRLQVKTLPAPLLRTASSTAVLVQLTPLLGALVGVVLTLLLIGVCIVAVIKLRKGRDRMTAENNGATEHDKGSAEPLQRNMGSHSSLDEKNPDVVPQENSEDEEKAFDRLKFDTQRIVYTPGVSISPPLPLSPTSYSKSYAALSLTTNPGYTIQSTLPSTRTLNYNSPLLVTRSPPNIYTRVPQTRSFVPYNHNTQQHQSQQPITTTNASPYGVTIPLLAKSNGFSVTNDLDDNS